MVWRLNNARGYRCGIWHDYRTRYNETPAKEELDKWPTCRWIRMYQPRCRGGVREPIVRFASLRVDFLREPEGGIVSDIMGPQEDFHSGPTWRRQVQTRHEGA